MATNYEKTYLVGEPKGPVFSVSKNTTTTRIVPMQFLIVSTSICRTVATGTEYGSFNAISLTGSPSGTSTKVTALFPTPCDLFRWPVVTGTSSHIFATFQVVTTTSATLTGGDTTTHYLGASTTDTMFIALQPGTTTVPFVTGIFQMPTLTVYRN